MMADHFVDIVENGLDLLSRIGNRLDSSMISHRIGTTRRVSVATTGYFEQAGESKKPDDLVDSDCTLAWSLPRCHADRRMRSHPLMALSPGRTSSIAFSKAHLEVLFDAILLIFLRR